MGNTYSSNNRQLQNVTLMSNIQYNSLAGVKKALQEGANPKEAEDAYGKSALVVAVTNSPHSDQLNIIKALVDAGADVNQLTISGRTPLAVAIMNGASKEVINYLVEKKVDINHSSVIDACKAPFCPRAVEAAKLIKEIQNNQPPPAAIKTNTL